MHSLQSLYPFDSSMQAAQPVGGAEAYGPFDSGVGTAQPIGGAEAYGRGGEGL